MCVYSVNEHVHMWHCGNENAHEYIQRSERICLSPHDGTVGACYKAQLLHPHPTWCLGSKAPKSILVFIFINSAATSIVSLLFTIRTKAIHPFSKKDLYYMYYSCVCNIQSLGGDQRTACGNQVYFSTMGVPRIELRHWVWWQVPLLGSHLTKLLLLNLFLWFVCVYKYTCVSILFSRESVLKANCTSYSWVNSRSRN